MKLRVRPITQKQAFAYINAHHRHHGAPRGYKFGIAIEDDNGGLAGVVCVGRPVARGYDSGADERIAEVTRLCTTGERNACSMLYSAARRAAFAMGYDRVITYTLAEETGSSLRASGFTEGHIVPGRSWSCKSRPRDDKHPTSDKRLWYAEAR